MIHEQSAECGMQALERLETMLHVGDALKDNNYKNFSVEWWGFNRSFFESLFVRFESHEFRNSQFTRDTFVVFFELKQFKKNVSM